MPREITTLAPARPCSGKSRPQAAAPLPLHGQRGLTYDEFPDLAPMIHRQRLVVEGHPRHGISDAQIVRYLSELSDVCAMRTLLPPVTHRSDLYGWAGWIHWETSGAHFYAWEQPLLFFSVDIYTCKEFSAERVLEFTADFFETTSLVGKEF